MSHAKVEKLLLDLQKSVNGAYARGQIDKKRQKITITKANLVESWKAGYILFLGKHVDKDFPTGNQWDWEVGVEKAWPLIIDRINRGKNSFIIEGGKSDSYVVFTEKTYSESLHRELKNHSVNFIQEQLGDSYQLTDASKEVELGNTENFAKAASISDIGIIKSGTTRHHKDLTTAGAAQFALSMKWLSKTRFFNSFLRSEEANTLEDKYGDIIYLYKTSGTKSRGLKVNINENIAISIGSKFDNFTGSEATDWVNIGPELVAAVRSWAVKDEKLIKTKGSDSIEENAVKSVDYLVMSTLEQVKNSRVTKNQKKLPNRKKKAPNIKGKAKKNKIPSTTKVSLPRAKGSTVPGGFEPLQLLGVLNQQLPNVLQGNMQYPGLENRTGRFAGSVRVTDINTTAGGFPSVGYTYQKNPYQTFEPGFAQGSVERDPRKLIDRSIREIAAQFVIGRLYTRRL